MPRSFAYASPQAALIALADRLQVQQNSSVTNELTGRVISEDIRADRDSPAADVSAMDGYAVCLAEIMSDVAIPVSGESSAGAPPPAMQSGAVVRIFTGALVPEGCDAVIKREDTEESGSEIRIRIDVKNIAHGENIRRAGENAASGSVVLQSGALIKAAQIATLANFGCRSARANDPVSVSILTTGDEVGLFEEQPPKPWQLRNSNQASLISLIQPHPWLRVSTTVHCPDDRSALVGQLRQSLQENEVVVLTGGVSMGDYDHVPDAVVDAGGEIVFHGLPIRPGKPILGAATADGKLILGLPGNPVSATVGGHRFLLPLAAKISGQTHWQPKLTTVTLANPSERSIPLHWMKLVRLIEDGVAEVVASKGSGDLVSLGASDGYVSIPPGESGPGPWPYFAW